MAQTGIALLYHGVFSDTPVWLQGGLHNTAPDRLHEHLAQVASTHEFVTVDEFAFASNRTGLACVSFDDAFKCVFEEALPVLESLSIPATVFVNGNMLCGGLFWRDKVRIIIDGGLEKLFRQQYPDLLPTAGRGFYRDSKHPAINSILIDQALDNFLSIKNIDTRGRTDVFAVPGDLMPHPLLSYGNHSHHHYVMASLSREQQRDEIQNTHRELAACPGITLSRCFSVPFGGTDDYNDDTLKLIRESGYGAVLMSRGRLNFRPVDRNFDGSGLALVERMMPRDHDINRSIHHALRAGQG